MRAAAAAGYGADFLPIERALTAHDGEGSAAWLRRKMARGEDWLPSLPGEAAAVFAAERNARARACFAGVAARCPALPAAGAGDTGARRAAGCRRGAGAQAVCRHPRRPLRGGAAQLAKSKRYALSRLRRIMLCAALGVKRDMAEGTPPYLRVLAMDDRGAELLRRMRDKARLPVIVRPAAGPAAGRALPGGL